MGQQRHLTTEAIILKIVTSGEINRYFTFISPTLGIQSATAFGAAKLKSRFCSSVQPFVKAKLFLYKSPKNNFYKLEDISDVTMNDFIKKNLSLIYIVSFFNEIILDCYIGSEEFKSHYYLLLYSIDILYEKNDMSKAFLFFTSKFLFLSGYNFHLINCKKCGQNFENYYFDYKEGGIFCEKDASNKHFLLTKKSALLWKEFLNKKYLYIKDINIEQKDFLLLFPIITFLINHIFEKELKTFAGIKEVFH